MSDFYSDTETSISLASSPLLPRAYANPMPHPTVPCPAQQASIARRFLAFLAAIITGALVTILLVICFHAGAVVWGPVVLTHNATLPAEWQREDELEEGEIGESEEGEETDLEERLRSAQRRRMTTAIVLARFNTWHSPSPWRVFAHGAQGAILQGPATPPAQIVGLPSIPFAPNDPLYEREMLVLDQNVLEDRDVKEAVERQLAVREIQEKQRAGHAQAANAPQVSIKATLVRDAVDIGEVPDDMSSIGRPVWAYDSEPSSPVSYRLPPPVFHHQPSHVSHRLPSPPPNRCNVAPRDSSLELPDMDVYGPVILPATNSSTTTGVRRKRKADAAGLEETSVKPGFYLDAEEDQVEQHCNREAKGGSAGDLFAHGPRFSWPPEAQVGLQSGR
ncbi:hypothetical protein NliqN6_6713 [Naganishia liquefaciens]|uniref:Transmembrane protein n=1 Tax=Naganishia liquefaciens TaxID=104408 RepID=A0A8H3YK92_9TREE|nr:hypothetical protein NliqN6_6713 [Naganishia liquefaciens]